jgi:hypothetical protein
MEKICAHCSESLDISLFHKHKHAKDGLGSWCKKCLKQRSQDKRREQGIEPKRIGIDPEKRKISTLNYRKRKAESFVYTITEKLCSHCQNRKPIADFRKDITGVDGYCSKCKKCQYEICTDSRKAYELNKWAKRCFLHAKKHSKYDFEINEAFIEELYEKQNGKCYWFNVDLKPSNIAKYPFQPSLDRLDREKGYTKDNVVLACYTANIGRNTSTVEIFQEFIKELKKSLNDKSE